MVKSLDGIKKSDSSEMERSRRLVLKTIGEEEKNIRPESRVVSRSMEIRRLDGITTKNLAPSKPPSAPVSKNSAETRDKERVKKAIGAKSLPEKPKKEERISADEIKKILQDSKFRDAELKRKKEAVWLLKEKERRKMAEEEKKDRAEEAARRRSLSEEKERQERLEQAIKEEKREKERLRRENKKREKVRREKRLERERKRFERRKKIKETLNSLAKKIASGTAALRVALTILMKYCRIPVLGGLAVYLAAYLVFAGALLFFNVNGANMRNAGDLFPPVPALISQSWAVDYFTYIDQTKRNHLTAETVKNFFIEKAVLEEIYSRFGLSPWLSGEEEARATAAVMFISDEDFNRVSLARAKKIYQTALAGNFVEVGAKYADKNGELSASEFEALGLDPGQIEKFSGGTIPALPGRDGYYILRPSGRGGYYYIFIKAKTLEDYIEEQKNQTRVWKLALD